MSIINWSEQTILLLLTWLLDQFGAYAVLYVPTALICLDSVMCRQDSAAPKHRSSVTPGFKTNCPDPKSVDQFPISHVL